VGFSTLLLVILDTLSKKLLEVCGSFSGLGLTAGLQGSTVTLTLNSLRGDKPLNLGSNGLSLLT